MYRLYIKTYGVVPIKVPNWHKMIFKNAKKISTVGLEITAFSFKGLSSTDWASRAMICK